MTSTIQDLPTVVAFHTQTDLMVPVTGRHEVGVLLEVTALERSVVFHIAVSTISVAAYEDKIYSFSVC